MTESMPTHRLRVWTRFGVSAEELWGQITDADGIVAEFPWWAPFRITRPKALAAALADGADSVRAPAIVGPVRFDIVARILTPGRSFEDRGESPFFSHFVHTRTVEPTADGARLLDDLLLAPAAFSPWVIRGTTRLFAARHRKLAQRLPADARTVATTVLRDVLEHELED